MDILILGADGYIGWALSQHLVSKGHRVWGMDLKFRRSDAISLLPIQEFEFRQTWFEDNGGRLSYANAVIPDFGRHPFDAIVNLAQYPSAPYSMESQRAANIVWDNNTGVVNALLWDMKERCPDAHLVHIGSMGEYGTPNCVIPEGEFTYEDSQGNQDTLLFPRRPSSIYHAAKVASTFMIEGCCRWWGLRATDIMQGVVFGHKVKGTDYNTRLDADEQWGTVIHRFCGQAVAGLPLTVYGAGTQVRSFLTLDESIRCLTLAIENPPEAGEYRTFNQFSQTYSINELASMVRGAALDVGIGSVDIQHVDNPRVEAPEHLYQPVSEKLPALGFEPATVGQHKGGIAELLTWLKANQKRVSLLMDVDEERTPWK